MKPQLILQPRGRVVYRGTALALDIGTGGSLIELVAWRGGRRRAGRSEPVAKVHDPYSTKRRRGRPPKIQPGWVTGRAYNHRIQLAQVWPKLEGPLLAARTEDEVGAAFEKHGQPYANSYVPGFIADTFALIHHRKFPKRPEARINFLGDSLGGRPNLSFRRSRDLCEQERAKERRKSPYHIIRKEFYVECSCGCKGPARDNACRKCGAEIPPSLHELLSPRGFEGL